MSIRLDSQRRNRWRPSSVSIFLIRSQTSHTLSEWSILAIALRKSPWPLGPPTGGVLSIELRRISEATKVSSRSLEAALIVSSVLPRFAPKLISELGIRKSAGV
jgi:hypothetical protein